MDLEVRFWDDGGAPVHFSGWGHGEAAPDRDPSEPNKFRYTSKFLRKMGFSVTRSETIGQLKKTLTDATPWLQRGLAVGRRIDTVSFNGVATSDDDLVGEVYQVKRTGAGNAVALSRVGDLGALDVTLLVTVAVWLPGDRLLSITFDECPTSVITVDDVRGAVAEASGTPLAATHLQRTYPTLRPVRFTPGQLLFGFDGERERGLWVKPPYPGPVRPALVPTPPPMRFELVDRAEVGFLEREEQWWEQLRVQPAWHGHAEALGGPQEVLEIRLDPPRQPQFYAAASSPTGVVHDLQLTAVLGRDGKTALCEPDGTTLGGLARVSGDALRSLHEGVCGEPLYLPDPATVALEGKVYAGHRRGEAHGTAEVAWARLGAAPVAARYRLSYDGHDELSVRVVAEVAGAAEGSVVEHAWEGAVSEGSGVLLFKGLHHALLFPAEVEGLEGRQACASAPGAVRPCLCTPFACFQRTKSGAVPDVVHSAIARRRAGLAERVFTVIAPGGGGGGGAGAGADLRIERVGLAGRDECDAKAFFDGLPREPRLVVASVVARDVKTSAERAVRVAVRWCDGDYAFGRKGDGHVKATLDMCDAVVTAGSFDGVQRLLRERMSLHALRVGAGPKPAGKKR